MWPPSNHATHPSYRLPRVPDSRIISPNTRNAELFYELSARYSGRGPTWADNMLRDWNKKILAFEAASQPCPYTPVTEAMIRAFDIEINKQAHAQLAIGRQAQRFLLLLLLFSFPDFPYRHEQAI
mmetsp:Transcript_24140/g.31398  ORF Transcript_24140/g.31398 Transcript_24140/m.31398 type:complete len:125 (+) Transcript_24140:2026-2400(+)